MDQEHDVTKAIGSVLRQRREALGITVDQVQEATKIRSRYLLALENDEFSQIPAEIYALGFLRAYARYLGLDGEALIRAWRSQPVNTETPEPARPPSRPSAVAHPTPTPAPVRRNPAPVRRPESPRPRYRSPYPAKPGISAGKGPTKGWAIAVLALILLLVGLLALMHRHPLTSAPPTAVHHAKKHPAKKTTKTSKSSPTSVPAPAVTVSETGNTPQLLTYQVTGVKAPLTVTFSFSAPCWIRERVNGVLVNTYGHTYTAGQSVTLSASRTLQIRMGNPSAVTATIASKTLSNLGSPGVPRDVEFILGS